MEPKRQRLRLEKGGLLVIPSSLLFLCLSVIPLVLLIFFSFISGNINVDGSIQGYTLANFVKLFSGFTFSNLMGKSILIGLAVTAICIVIAYPTAWGIAKVVKPKNRNLLVMLVIVPFFTSQLLLIYAMMVLLQSKGIIMTFLGFIGIADPSTSILYSNTAVIIVLVYEYLPYMILSLYSSLEGINDNVIHASLSLGAGKVKTFLNVIFPMSIPGLLSGILLVLVPVTGSFVEPALVGGPNGMMVGSLINSQFSVVLNMGYGAAISFMFLIIISIIMAVIKLLINRANRSLGGI
jgi:ABC-type spermidine/putrescine transport system, permease component I